MDDMLLLDSLISIFKKTDAYLSIKDHNLKYIMVSDAFVKLTGEKDAQSVIGKTDFEIFEHYLAKKYHSDDEFLINKNEHILNCVGLLPCEKGKKKLCSTSKYILKDESGNFIGIYTISTELSKDIEEKEALNKELEKKKNFIIQINHDLRTSLNGIIGLKNLMLLDNTIQGKARENLDIMDKSCKYLMDLINDTLEMSKIEFDNFVLKPKVYNSRSVFNNLVMGIIHEIKSKNIDLVVKGEKYDKFIYIDKLRIKQIFDNILSNAIKFTPSEGKIELISKVIEETDNYVIFNLICKDTGIGISKDFLDIIFEPFTQECRMKNGHAVGSGLGMAIVKKIVDSMNGKIVVNSIKGKGTEVSITLKFDKAIDYIEEENPSIDKSGLIDKKVLICDDTSINFEILRLLLENEGCVVEKADKGLTALKKIRQAKKYDLVLIDLKNTIHEDTKTAKKVKTIRKSSKDVPIIAITSNAFEEERKECIEAGMDECLYKPINPDNLYQKILELIN